MRFTDAVAHTITLNHPPKKIISLVPSQTELLYSLGLEAEVVGITKFCVLPAHWFKHKEKIGGTKNIHLKKIFELQPDLILANKEENEKKDVFELQKKFNVWTSEVQQIEEARQLIISFGQITEKENEAHEILRQTDESLEKINQATNGVVKRKAVYLIWRDPYMSINKNTFIHAMLHQSGFENIFADANTRYPIVSITDIVHKNPEIIFLSSEPYPFGLKHLDELKKYFPKDKMPQIQLVDGMYFSWYGSRIIHAYSYFNKALKPLL